MFLTFVISSLSSSICWQTRRCQTNVEVIDVMTALKSSGVLTETEERQHIRDAVGALTGSSGCSLRAPLPALIAIEVKTAPSEYPA